MKCELAEYTTAEEVTRLLADIPSEVFGMFTRGFQDNGVEKNDTLASINKLTASEPDET